MLSRSQPAVGVARRTVTTRRRICGSLAAGASVPRTKEEIAEDVCVHRCMCEVKKRRQQSRGDVPGNELGIFEAISGSRSIAEEPDSKDAMRRPRAVGD